MIAASIVNAGVVAIVVFAVLVALFFRSTRGWDQRVETAREQLHAEQVPSTGAGGPARTARLSTFSDHPRGDGKAT